MSVSKKPATVPARTAEQISRTAAGPRPLPQLQGTPTRRQPATARATAASGLDIIAVSRPTSPMVELRLRIPMGAASARGVEAHAARAELLAETILLGTATRDRQQIDRELAEVGGTLSAQVGPQRLLISGSVLAPGLPVLLDILADALANATFPAADLRRERDRLIEHLAITSAQPSSIARRHLQRRRFGDHPAALELPQAAAVAAQRPAQIRALYREAVLPSGSVLVLVGDLRAKAAAGQAQEALAAWATAGTATALGTPPAIVGGPIVAYPRAGAVQTQTRLTSAGPLRTDSTYPAAQLANLVLGGYFTSRLVTNLREDKGYVYHAQSTFEFWPGRGALTIGYDTATSVAAAALVETRYELGRIALNPPSDAEVDAARTYAIGSLAAALSTQSGYASMLTSLAAMGLDGSWLTRHQRNLATVSTAEVADAAARLFAPSGMTGVIVGDLEASGAALSRLDGVLFDDGVPSADSERQRGEGSGNR